MTLDILNIIELGGQWVVDIDDDNLPVSFLLIEQSHDTKNLDLLDLARVSNQLANLAYIQWVIVTFGLGLWVNDIGVFPSLVIRSALYSPYEDVDIPEGRHHSSRDSPYEGSSYGQNVACPSWYLASKASISVNSIWDEMR